MKGRAVSKWRLGVAAVEGSIGEVGRRVGKDVSLIWDEGWAPAMVKGSVHWVYASDTVVDYPSV